ncbi:hypothetical protein BDR26DRAFT_936204 [Obelidium mucronatum]|nr:hypothetical protein BDR26DRAFT_936204 [Obelidium mucronatum]
MSSQPSTTLEMTALPAATPGSDTINVQAAYATTGPAISELPPPEYDGPIPFGSVLLAVVPLDFANAPAFFSNSNPPEPTHAQLASLTGALLQQRDAIGTDIRRAPSVAIAVSKRKHLQTIFATLAAAMSLPLDYIFSHADAMLQQGCFESSIDVAVERVICNPAAKCFECMRSLVTRNSQNVKIITMNGVESAQYLPKFCQNRLCRWGAFDVDSCVFKDKEGSVRLYYQMEIIKTRGYIFLNDKYLITWDTLEWLCVDVVKDLKAKFWTSQQMYRNKFGQNALPAPADSALFKRAFVLFGFLRLAEWIKSHTSFTNSAPGLVTPEGFAIVRIVVGGDTKTMDDLEEGMLLYSQWFESYFVVKNKHSCELCHQVGLHEEVLSAIVDDGKVMGHRVCPIRPCKLPLVNNKVGFCQQHEAEAATCFVYGCSQQRRKFEASGFGNAQKASQVYACGNQSHIEIETQVRAKGVDPANKFYNRKQATQRRGKNIKSTQVSTCHQERHEAPQTGFVKFGMHEYFLPCLFTLVWSCGVIANVRKMYTFESTDDIILLLVETFEIGPQRPIGDRTGE